MDHVWTHYQTVWAHQDRMDRASRRAITARLGDAFTPEELCQAISNARSDSWESREDHSALRVLLRDGPQVRRFLRMPARQLGERGSQRLDAGTRAVLGQMSHGEWCLAVGHRYRALKGWPEETLAEREAKSLEARRVTARELEIRMEPPPETRAAGGLPWRGFSR